MLHQEGVRTISRFPDPAEPTALELTGERTAPGIWHETYWYARHLAAYRAAAPRCRGLVVDAGCGEGYGAALLASHTRTVVGLDYDAPALARAVRQHPPVGGFARSNVVALPLADACVDVVVSLQVIEHIWTPHDLLHEAARVLRPGGLMLLTTPNRLTFSPGLRRGERPTNPFHVREFDAQELAALVGEHLDVVSVGGVHAGPRLTDLDQRFGTFTGAQLAEEPAAWSPELTQAVRSVVADDFVVREDEADGALDLMVLARRPKVRGAA
jgi:SAM-dependent methyltransferase